MSTYTVEQLGEEGPPFAMAMLLECIGSGEPFITYGDIGSELEHQLKIKTIFPTQIGHVAGSLMNQILEVAPKAPLINVLITRPNGIPGVGVGGYLADRYNDESLRKWNKVSLKRKKEIIERERKKIFEYTKWSDLNNKLFGKKTPALRKKQEANDDNYKTPHHGGPAESKEHKKLKNWVSNNPKAIGIRQSFGTGVKESRLLSGDEIDVLFSEGDSFVTVEVKSIRSNDEDFKRGIYQCVKYREVKIAEHAPYSVNVQSILVTERQLTPELKERAKILNVKLKCVSVN
ncbi:MAG: hypothetical protein OEY36_06320 [Gammaproteobacteria bacterium]|nr:hypothetical protein [Gammaproteobacteria bacterium]